MRETAVEYDGMNGTDSNAFSPAISLHASESPPKFVAPIVQCARLRPTLLPWHRRCACACAASRAVCPAAPCISTPLIVALTRRKKQVYMSSYAMSIIIAALTASIVYVFVSYPCLCITSTVLRSDCRDMQPQGSLAFGMAGQDVFSILENVLIVHGPEYFRAWLIVPDRT